jgi:hypothetical protein
MNLYEFLAHALEPEIYQRKGQRFMNMLYEYRPDLEDELRGCDARARLLERELGAPHRSLNPFYDDSKLPAAIQWVKDNWGEEDR